MDVHGHFRDLRVFQGVSGTFQMLSDFREELSCLWRSREFRGFRVCSRGILRSSEIF